METLGYDYQATLIIDIPGFDGEEVGANPGYLPWTAGEASGSHQASYYYSDSNAVNQDGSFGNMNDSSKVFITVTDNWTATVNDDNSITITINTVINEVRRGDILGNPNSGGTVGRDIRISRYEGGRDYFVVNGNPINVAGVLASNIDMGTETIVLPPGKATERSSIFVLNHTSGFSWSAPGSTDQMHAGVSFRNNLPADYRPGATYINGQWYSHNRAGGACHGWQGSSWVEQRTEEGGSAGGNPPLYQNGGWKNQYKVGING